MKNEKITLKIPNGMIVDLEKTTPHEIVLKQNTNIKNFDDLVFNKVKINGYYIGPFGSINYIEDFEVGHEEKPLFRSNEEAIRAKVAAIISQLMPFYGGAFTYEEWTDYSVTKYPLKRNNNKIKFEEKTYLDYNFLSFRTEELRTKFVKENKKLVKDYLMIKY